MINKIIGQDTKLPGIILIYFLISLIIPNFVLAFTETYTIWGTLTNILLPGGVLLLLASISRKPYKTIWYMFPLLFFAAFQIVLLYLYGRSIIAVDMFLNLTTTNPEEATELLKNIWPSVLLVVIIYVPSLVSSAWMTIKKSTISLSLNARIRKTGIILTSAGIATMILAYISGPYSLLKDLYPVNVCYNIRLAGERLIKINRYYETSADFTFHAHPDSDSIERKIALLVIGESSRAENWQLCGYSRDTNPQLSQIDSLLVSRTTLSESNTTHKSVPMLLSQVDATSFDTIYNVKSIITAFKEAGYATAYFSNQARNGSFIEFFGNEADTVVFTEEGYNPPDMSLIDLVQKTLEKKAPRQLIVLHTHGSHFNYPDRYTEADRHFIPDSYPEAAVEYRDNLINAYDNTIVATDRFLATLINMIGEDPDVWATMIYTSDHGEDIYDDYRELMLHASPLPTWHQINVPFIAWMSPAYRAAHPERYDITAANLEKPVSSSRSFFHTALDLADISTPVLELKAAVTSIDYTPRPHPLYLDDHNKAITDFESVRPDASTE